MTTNDAPMHGIPRALISLSRYERRRDWHYYHNVYYFFFFFHRFARRHSARTLHLGRSLERARVTQRNHTYITYTIPFST